VNDLEWAASLLLTEPSSRFAPCWPLEEAAEDLLRYLKEILGQLGAWRFLRAPLVSPRVADYPEPYHESLDGVALVLARTAWHAHLDAELRVVARGSLASRISASGATSLELTSVDRNAGVFYIMVRAIGRDAFAAFGCHEIGRACLAMASLEHPFRSSADAVLPDLAYGTIAAVALGLGVLAANGAHQVHNTGRHFALQRVGGLDDRELTFLLAVQATVRGDDPDALASLYPTQAAAVAAWRATLAPHADALRDRLQLEASLEPVPPVRPATPRMPLLEELEAEVTVERTYRVRGSRRAPGGALGFVIGAVGAIAITGMLVPAVGCAIGGAAAGWILGRRSPRYWCADCSRYLTPAMTACRHCEREIAGEVARGRQHVEPDDGVDAAG
jgi:hypothetical protein